MHVDNIFYADCIHYKQSELMLMRHARAYGSCCSQVSSSISIHFIAIHSFAAKNCPKNHLTSIFLGFKVIEVDIPKKLVASACCDKQHVCAYLQLFSH